METVAESHASGVEVKHLKTPSCAYSAYWRIWLLLCCPLQGTWSLLLSEAHFRKATGFRCCCICWKAVTKAAFSQCHQPHSGTWSASFAFSCPPVVHQFPIAERYTLTSYVYGEVIPTWQGARGTGAGAEMSLCCLLGVEADAS